MHVIVAYKRGQQDDHYADTDSKTKTSGLSRCQTLRGVRTRPAADPKDFAGFNPFVILSLFASHISSSRQDYVLDDLILAVRDGNLLLAHDLLGKIGIAGDRAP